MARNTNLNIIGHKFHKLTVSEYLGKKDGLNWFRCTCECGGTADLRYTEINKERVQSCGCLSKKFFHNLIGQTFNGNTAITYVGQNKQHCHVYEFKCNCGKTFQSEGNDIKSGKIKSCGCRWNSDLTRNARPNKALESIIYAEYRLKAKQRDHEFQLTKEQVHELIFNNCHYCNSPPLNAKKYKNYTLNYNGIDRLDNNLGYEIGNVVTACKYCNQAKHMMTAGYFKDLLNRIFKAKQDKHGFWKDEE